MLAKPKPLTAAGIFETFSKISRLSGKQSGERKRVLIKNMLVACQGNEARFLIRALQGNLRIKVAEKTVFSALAQAVTLTPPSSSTCFFTLT
jgi:DNA ligase-1